MPLTVQLREFNLFGFRAFADTITSKVYQYKELNKCYRNEFDVTLSIGVKKILECICIPPKIWATPANNITLHWNFPKCPR